MLKSGSWAGVLWSFGLFIAFFFPLLTGNLVTPPMQSQTIYWQTVMLNGMLILLVISPLWVGMLFYIQRKVNQARMIESGFGKRDADMFIALQRSILKDPERGEERFYYEIERKARIENLQKMPLDKETRRKAEKLLDEYERMEEEIR